MNYYINNFIEREQEILAPVPSNLSIIVVIPCYNELGLISALSSLKNCNQPNGRVEVITVFNSSVIDNQSILETNELMFAEAKSWTEKNTIAWLNFYFINASELPEKDAGVGLARKIGMDEAVYRFESIHKDGIIACFDADATCHPNYLVELEKHFEENSKSPACSIHFEHPLKGDDFSKQNYKAIAAYELHLRYYKNALKYCGFPYAYHTIGSSMAVKSKAYQKQGGMNKRKAGEDFYFLQKMMALGNYTELIATSVFPSPRVSDRVPFGTGRAMQNYLSNSDMSFTTYNFNSFIDLKVLVDNLDKLWEQEIELPNPVSFYLKTINFEDNLKKIKQNSTSLNHFKQLFFNWFNAFKVLKYVHFARDNYYRDGDVFEEANKLLTLLYDLSSKPNEMLKRYRALDLNNH